MKSMNDTNNNGSQINNSTTWLGFSLSPHMKMEAPSSSVPSFFLNSSGLCYGGGVGPNGNFPSALSVMPLKSDGSLCIMEALTRSHQEGMVSSSSPKLEDFLGGATMGNQYGNHERESMVLSLDSLYYHNHQNSQHETNRNLSQTFHQPPYRHDEHESHHFYSGLELHGLYQRPLEEESKETHLPDCDSHDLKNWVTTHFSNQITTASVDDDEASASVSAINTGELQSLTLSMSPGSQSSCVTVPRLISPPESKKRGPGKEGQRLPVHRKSIDTFGQRTSQYRGVTRHRWTGRYEAHLWDNSCKKEGQTRKGRQVYLGGYDMEEKAARSYDLAALKYWGASTHINFSIENYQTEMEDMKNMTRQEYVAHLRRKSSGFSRGASMYRGVTRHHQHGRWQARIGRVAGNKDLYLGTFSTQEEAAEAYDIAAIKFRGVNAVTNFNITRYDIERIMASNTLLAGELARRNKEIEPNSENCDERISSIGSDWKMVLHQNAQPPATCVESVDQKSMSIENYSNSSFSIAMQDMVGIDAYSSQTMVNKSPNVANHFSNPSSLVTSLGSSREASPDKSCPTMLSTKPPLASKFISPNTSASSLLSSVQMGPAAISMAHMPYFAAWNDT